MSSLVNDKMMNRIFSVLRKESATHIIFWSILFLLFTVVEGSKGNMLITIKKEIINIGFFALIVYLNIVYIFPKYVENKNLFGHLLTLFVIALLITPIKTLIIFFLHNNDPQAQATLLKNQLYIFFSTFLVGLSSSIYSIFREWLRSQREKQELQKQTLTSELRFLKSQINPHFLFNTLNNLYALTLKKSDLAPEIVLKLSEMMRYMLYECN